MIRDASISEIERTLAELRSGLVGEDRTPNLRTSVMTHMAWVPERWVDEATRTLGGLEERHPSRTILLFPRPESERDAIDADVDLRCFASGAGGEGVCFEVLELHLLGKRAAAPASVVSPLLVSDLPVFLRWRGELAFGAQELEQLTDISDRLIVDSVEWPDPDEAFGQLPDLFERTCVSDIAWERTQPAREALAALWPGIASVDRLSVAGPRAEALLLAGWLGGRLDRDVALDHEPAGEIELVEADGEAVELSRAGEKSSSDLLSDQLDVFGRDAIYEEAVRSFARVPT